jgi:hypothetical protein
MNDQFAGRWPPRTHPPPLPIGYTPAGADRVCSPKSRLRPAFRALTLRAPAEARMTKKKVRHIPSDDDLVRIFTGQAFKDVITANWPGDPADVTRAKPEEVAKYAENTLLEARVYARDAVKPEVKTTADRPQRKPIIEAAISFANGICR